MDFNSIARFHIIDHRGGSSIIFDHGGFPPTEAQHLAYSVIGRRLRSFFRSNIRVRQRGPMPALRHRLNARPTVHQERDDGADQENHEQDFRDAGRADRDAAEAEERGNQRDDEKYHGIVKHGCTLNCSVRTATP